MNLIKAIIGNSREHLSTCRTLSLFNELLKVYGSFYFATSLMKSIAHIFESTNAVEILRPILENPFKDVTG